MKIPEKTLFKDKQTGVYWLLWIALFVQLLGYSFEGILHGSKLGSFFLMDLGVNDYLAIRLEKFILLGMLVSYALTYFKRFRFLFLGYSLIFVKISKIMSAA